MTKKRKSRKPKNETHKDTPKRREVKLDELEAILARTQQGALTDEDHEKLKAAIDTLAYLTTELETKGASIRRLRKLIFGSSTEKTSKLFDEKTEKESSSDNATEATSSDESREPAAGTGTDEGGGDEKDTASESSSGQEENDKDKKRKGHGRRSASSYTGAAKTTIAHKTLSHGDPCPECLKGKLYRMAEPAVLVRVTGMAPLSAEVIERERLRCNLCGAVFTAQMPLGVSEEKYDETVSSMIGLLKYGCGFPFNRLERLEGYLGIPLPASTQWELVEKASQAYEPAYQEIIRQAAQGQLLHNDDTTMKILDLERPEPDPASGSKKERTGTFTSGIISSGDGHRIALFYTGYKHAGENLAELLKKRAAELGPPIQMCDALSRNIPVVLETILSNCLVHARRNFVEVVESFPEQVKYVLEKLKEIYKNDDIARAEEMSPDERLLYPQEHSGPPMEELEKWLKEQIEEKKVEPNSSLGGAIKYMRKHWKELTLFLRMAGAPLDNNICERALKKAILHRKNAMFYKTENGAHVGDMHMSLIHTCELNDADPFDYLVQLQRHAEQIAQSPSDWMPWNYRETLARLCCKQ